MAGAGCCHCRANLASRHCMLTKVLSKREKCLSRMFAALSLPCMASWVSPRFSFRLENKTNHKLNVLSTDEVITPQQPPLEGLSGPSKEHFLPSQKKTSSESCSCLCRSRPPLRLPARWLQKWLSCSSGCCFHFVSAGQPSPHSLVKQATELNESLDSVHSRSLISALHKTNVMLDARRKPLMVFFFPSLSSW